MIALKLIFMLKVSADILSGSLSWSSKLTDLTGRVFQSLGKLKV
jgi:hypothetical protein